MKTKFEVGTAKLMLERVMSYVGMLNFFMIMYLYVIQSPMGIDAWYWIVTIGLILPVIMIVDWVFVYPSVLNVSYGKKNKEFQELRNDIRNLQKHLTELDKRLK